MPGPTSTTPKSHRKLAKGYIKRIHVNQFKIRANDPDPISIQTSDGPIAAAEIEIRGSAKVIYQPDNPLSCGARLWIETTDEVEVLQ